nr:polygalacturonase-like [Ipomoea batatas]
MKIRAGSFITIFVLAVLCFVFFNEALAAGVTTFNVVDLGAEPDGETDAAEIFQRAWCAACGSPDPAKIYVPEGMFLIRQAYFSGPCENNNIVFEIWGTLLAPSDYNVIGNDDNWLAFENVDGVAIIGGKLYGQGAGLWACKDSGNECPKGATNLSITNSKNVVVTGLLSLNSQMFHVVVNRCSSVTMQDIEIKAPGDSPNTDGIHVQLSYDVTILNSKITTGDDCISIGPGTKNLWMENILCGPGHGVSIGSLAKNLTEKGVQNVTLKTATFKNTQNGVRIKAWGRPSKGFAKKIVFKDLKMRNVHNPILIDQNYCPDNKNCPGQASGVKIMDVTYQNILGTSATEVAVKFDCSKKNPCKRIRMSNVKLKFKKKRARASCAYVAGEAYGQIEPSSCL